LKKELIEKSNPDFFLPLGEIGKSCLQVVYPVCCHGNCNAAESSIDRLNSQKKRETGGVGLMMMRHKKVNAAAGI
jgi:hypothetical protein